MITRLVVAAAAALVLTGVAPASAYRLTPDLAGRVACDHGGSDICAICVDLNPYGVRFKHCSFE